MLIFENKTCLGVDVSGRDVKIVELAKSRAGFEVVQAARLEIGSADLAIVLKQFLTDTDTQPSRTVWSLPTNSCSVKFAQLPKANPADTARMARYEAESQIPIPLGDLVWGYSAAKPARGEELSQVVIAAARRAIVEETAGMLESAGVASTAAMVASLAEARSLKSSLVGDEPALIVSIGEIWTSLTTVKGGQVTSCRSVHIGVDELQGADANTDGDAGSSDSQPDAQWIEKLASEIRRSALFSTTGLGGKSIGTAILTGDGAAFLGLAQALARDTGLTVKTGDPWGGMAMSEVAAHNKHYVPASFAVATGLAIAGLERGAIINLMPDGRAEELLKRRKQVLTMGALASVAVVLLVFLLLGQSGISAKSDELDALRMQKASAQRKQTTSVQPEMRTTTATIRKIVAELGKKPQSPLEVLRLLSENLPKSCWLTELRFDAGKSVVMKGNALSNSAVADTVYLLTNSAWFDSVSLDYSNLGKSGSAALYDFQIKCALPPDSSVTAASGKKSAKKGSVVR